MKMENGSGKQKLTHPHRVVICLSDDQKKYWDYFKAEKHLKVHDMARNEISKMLSELISEMQSKFGSE